MGVCLNLTRRSQMDDREQPRRLINLPTTLVEQQEPKKRSA
jgi:hypothetical protein